MVWKNDTHPYQFKFGRIEIQKNPTTLKMIKIGDDILKEMNNFSQDFNLKKLKTMKMIVYVRSYYYETLFGEFY